MTALFGIAAFAVLFALFCALPPRRDGACHGCPEAEADRAACPACPHAGERRTKGSPA